MILGTVKVTQSALRLSLSMVRMWIDPSASLVPLSTLHAPISIWVQLRNCFNWVRDFFFSQNKCVISEAQFIVVKTFIELFLNISTGSIFSVLKAKVWVISLCESYCVKLYKLFHQLQREVHQIELFKSISYLFNKEPSYRFWNQFSLKHTILVILSPVRIRWQTDPYWHPRTFASRVAKN